MNVNDRFRELHGMGGIDIYETRKILDEEFIQISEVDKIIDDVYKDLDMGKTIQIFIQRLKEKLKDV